MEQADLQFLYRYRHLQGKHRERTKLILTDSILYFAKPSSFNDPYDCKVDIRPDFSKKVLRTKYVNQLKKKSSLNRQQRRAKTANDLKGLDRKQFLDGITERLKKDIDTLGVLSLSETESNILLWSHYAAGHTGLCLKFQATDETPFFGTAQPVQYSRNDPMVMLFEDPKESVKSLLLTKALDWEYEKEWRIVDHESGAGNKKFPEELLVGVILGARMLNDDKNDIINCLNKRTNPVQKYQASLSSDAYELEIKPYEP